MRVRARLTVSKSFLELGRRAAVTMRRELGKAVRRSTAIVQERARNNLKNPQGQLAKSIRRQTKFNRGVVFSAKWYAAVQEEGSAYLPGGVLRPRRKEYMRFQAGGRWVRVKQVRIKGQHYLKGALESSMGEIQRELNDAAEGVAEALTRGD